MNDEKTIYVGTEEAAKRLGITRMTVGRWIETGFIHAWRLNPCNPRSPWRIKNADINEILEKRKGGDADK